MKTLVWVALFGLLTACGGAVTVRMQSAEPQKEGLLARVQVNDMRTAMVTSQRSTFGMPMGNISFDPPEPQLVKNLLEVELTRILRGKGVQSPQDYVCDIAEFGVNTTNTALYWDVTGRVRLVLKHDGKEYSLVGTHTERTYVWPGESIVKKVVDESLKQITVGLEQVS